VPRDQFTPARNDLARRLRAAGLREQADEVRALAKPSVPVWAVNRLARVEPDEVAAFARAGEGLVEAQRTALAGDRERFGRAREEHAQLLRTLAARAAELLDAEGRAVTQPTRERIGETLRAASLEPEARAALREGRLHGDVDAGGFALLAGVELPAATKQRDGRESGGRAQAAELKRRLREAQGKARDLRRRADKQAREAARARGEAESAEESARDLGLEASAAADAAADLERQLGDLT
jgi:hypothetical protein